MTVPVSDSVTESVFNLTLWRSLFLVKLQAFTISGSARIWSMEYAFRKAWGLSFKYENFTKDIGKVCAAVCFWWSLRPLPEMSVKESVIRFVFSKVLGLY